MPRIGGSTHGESRVRILRIVRRGDRHDPRDLTVSLRFEGDFAAAFRDGHGGGVVPGETLRNLVHTSARLHGTGEIECFGLELCERVLKTHPQITKVRAEVAEQPWQRIEVGGKAQGQAFVLSGPEQRIAAITSNGTQIAVVSGIDNLTVMRTAGFAPPRARPADSDESDALQDGLPPLVVGALSVRWTYSTPDVTFGPYRQGVRSAVIDTVALHASRSVQYTLYAIGDVLLASYPEISVVSLAMHERPYRPADLFHANLENPDELFVAVEEPVGVVEVTLERDRTDN
jgi:urate oxidase